MSDYRCKLCGRKLKNWKSIQAGMGPTCESRYLNKFYKEQQITLDSILGNSNKKKERYK